MATPSELKTLIDRKITLLEASPERFNDIVAESQKKIYRQLLDLLSSLDIDPEGNIKTTKANFSRLNQIVDSLQDKIFDGKYEEALSAFSDDFNKTASQSDNYFNESDFDFKEKPIYKELVKQAQSNVLEMLGRNGIDVNFLQPIKNILNQSVTTGIKFSDAVDQLNLFIKGSPERLGRLESYVKQIATDSLFQFDSSYMKKLGEDVGAEWWRYVGGTIATTRPFCIQQTEKEWFTTEEVEELANRQWAGKIPGTTASSIFSLRGGYNCRHTWIPVSEALVPRTIKEAA